MELSKNFQLSEFLKSQTATRYGIKDQFDPPMDIINNLRLLCEKILQPVRNALPGIIIISSGYRCSELNVRLKGARASQHLIGQAADCNYYESGIEDNMKLFNQIIKMGLPFDQLIKEYGTEEQPAWIHVSYSDRQRKQILRIK